MFVHTHQSTNTLTTSYIQLKRVTFNRNCVTFIFKHIIFVYKVFVAFYLKRVTFN